MSLISPEYLELQRTFHVKRPDYGVVGKNYASKVLTLCREAKTYDILDYGCGKRTLEQALGFQIRNYDPAIPGLDAVPAPADIVTCTDVLEHIEPECMHDVLTDIARCAKRFAFLTIATRPASKTLPDGRNAHISIHPSRWWLDRLMHYFEIEQWQRLNDGEVFCLASRLKP